MVSGNRGRRLVRCHWCSVYDRALGLKVFLCFLSVPSLVRCLRSSVGPFRPDERGPTFGSISSAISTRPDDCSHVSIFAPRLYTPLESDKFTTRSKPLSGLARMFQASDDVVRNNWRRMNVGVCSGKIFQSSVVLFISSARRNANQACPFHSRPPVASNRLGGSRRATKLEEVSSCQVLAQTN